MAGEIFAAIDVGSYELGMKIFEISPKKGVKQIDHIRHHIDLGSETYATGRISYSHVSELTRVLIEFRKIMETYGVTHYQAYGTSAIRETNDIYIVLDQLEQRTNIHIDVLSNSEQRFLDYKSVAIKGGEFQKILEKPTAIVDIGGGSIQISLFEKDTLVTTQNLRLGVLRLHSQLDTLHASKVKYPELVEELVSSQLSVYSKMYLKDHKVSNIIILDDYIEPIVSKISNKDYGKGYVESGEYLQYLKRLNSSSKFDIAKSLGIPDDNVPLVFTSALLIKCILKATGADLMWTPGVTLCDGIAFEYAEKKKIIKITHDFEQDILACARNISKRYMGSKSRSETLQLLSMKIFDSTKKLHGLGKREKLLLQISAILHDCGKYISMVNLGDCSYNIIMSTEIIGLSHKERKMVANIVRFNHEPFEYYGENAERYSGIDKKSYLTISKLSAILRVANGLDRTHKQKFKNIKMSLKESELQITIDSMEDITIEKGLFTNRADFFEEVFGIRPVIRQKRGF